MIISLGWLFNQEEHSKLSEKDLIELLKEKKVKNIKIEMFKTKNLNSSLKENNLDDMVDFFEGGKAIFQIENKSNV